MEIILIIIICFLIYLAWKYLKLPKINCTALFTGAPKTGKSTLAVATAISKTRKARIKTYFYNTFLLLSSFLEHICRLVFLRLVF